MMTRHDIAVADADDIAAWRGDDTRTTYLFDLRTPEEIVADPAPAFRPALSGQLVQATDQWVGVRPARLVLLDDLGLRGAVAAFRSEEHTSDLQSLMRTSYSVFCLKKKKKQSTTTE